MVHRGHAALEGGGTGGGSTCLELQERRVKDRDSEIVARSRIPVAALLGASIVSLVGSALTLIALPWFVLQTTGSATKTGLTGFAVALPSFLIGIFGGTIIDRLGYRYSSVIADLVSGGAIALIPLLYHSLGLQFWQLLLLVFIGSLLELPGLSARRSMLPDLARLAALPLERLNAAFEGTQYLAVLIGPVVAGLLIAWLGASNVLWLDAASFAISALAVGIAVPTTAAGVAGAATGRYLDELRAGLRFLWDDRLLLILAISLALGNFLTSPTLAVTLPVYAARVFGRPAILGLLISALGAGSLIGTAGYGVLGRRLGRRATWLAGFLGFPLLFLVLALRPPLTITLLALLGAGVIIGPIQPLLVTVRHERIPPELRGRLFSTFSAISQVVVPLGMVGVGAVVGGLGLRFALVALCVGAEAIAGAMFFIPSLHQMDSAS